MRDPSRLPLVLLLGWVAGAAAWNLEGVRRLGLGQQALGPTATLGGAAITILFGLLVLYGLRRARWLVIATCTIVALGASYTVWGAFTGQPQQWPSPGWRWGGALLNSVGAGSAVWLILRSLRGERS